MLNHYNEESPMIICSDVEISIKELAQSISGLMGYEGNILVSFPFLPFIMNLQTV
jgi:hypothetical protein